VTLWVKGKEIGSSTVVEKDRPFAFDIPLPADLTGHPLGLTVEVSKTLHPPGDPRELGLIFGTFEVK
jgi:hypothetical protein